MTANYDLPGVVEKRVRFFDGQFLQEQDFVDEQKYHLDRERRHLRLLHVAGIADGLAVAAKGANQVTVAPGTAIDSDGRQLALAEAATVDLPAETFNDKQGIELYLSYRESEEDEQTEAGSRDFTRWLERPELTPIAPGEAYAGATPPVLLARVALDNAGRVTVDDTVRSYSGLRLPGPAADAATLRGTADGQVSLAGSLSVDGNVGIGTTDPSSDLAIGNFDGQNRYLALKVAGGNKYRTGIKLWAWQENFGYSIEFDERGSTGNGLHIRTHNVNADGESRVFVAQNGNVGIGTTTPEQRLTINGELRFTTGSTVSAAGRLHVSGDEILYLLNKSGVVVGKEWGGTGSLTVQGDLQAGGAATVQGNLIANGNVGIGTTTPEQRLTVNGQLRFTASSTISAAGRLHVSGDEILYLLNKNGVVVGKEWGGTGSLTVQGDLQAAALTVQGDLQAATQVTLKPVKKVGEAMGSSTVDCKGRLHITGDEILWLLNKNGVIVSKNWGGTGDLTVEGKFNNISDARLKKRIRRLESPLDRLTEVRGVSYLPRQVGGRDGQSEERPAIGVVAQEVEAVFPQLVSTIEGHGYKAVDYSGLTAVLLEAVKELKTALDALRERTAALEAHA